MNDDEIKRHPNCVVLTVFKKVIVQYEVEADAWEIFTQLLESYPNTCINHAASHVLERLHLPPIIAKSETNFLHRYPYVNHT